MQRRTFMKGVGAAAVLSGLSTRAFSAPQHNLQLGFIMAEGDPCDVASRKFKAIVEERTGGDVTCTIHTNGLLGTETGLWDGMQIGSVDIAVTGVGPVSAFAPQFQGVLMPYAVRDYEQIEKIYNGEVGDELKAVLRNAKGGEVLDFWYRGPRNVTANKAVRTPDDIKGLKLRTPQGKIYLEAFAALGAQPTPMAFGELFNALEQGVVDGQENPLDVIITMHFDEVQSHVSLTQHQLTPYFFSIRGATLDALSADQQQAVREAAVEAGVFEKELILSSEESNKKTLADRGMTVVEDVDRAAFAAILDEKARQLEADGVWMKGLYDRLQDA